MLLYFDFEDRRVKAEVNWPKQRGTIPVQITDPRLAREMPTDLFFEVGRGNKVVFTVENPDNKRLTELQNVIAKRLQEFVNKS
jgi:hypothetical protein